MPEAGRATSTQLPVPRTHPRRGHVTPKAAHRPTRSGPWVGTRDRVGELLEECLGGSGAHQCVCARSRSLPIPAAMQEVTFDVWIFGRKFAVGATAGLFIGTIAVSGAAAATAVNTAEFEMKVSTAASASLPTAHANVDINSIGPVEIMSVETSGLPPKTDFDFFVIQVRTNPFGGGLVPGRSGDQ